MKKIAVAITSSVTYLYAASLALAQDIKLDRPKVDGKNVGYADLSEFIRNIMALIFFIALILVLVMLVWGAVDWILSGGEKDAVGKARGKILNALIGLAVLAVAWAIFVLAGRFLGFNILQFNIPTPTL